MRRTFVYGALVLVALPGAAAPARAAGDKVPLAVKLTGCTTGADPAERSATFTASMPRLSGTQRMSMRFRLLQRRGTTGRFKPVSVPNWGGWEKSDPGRPGFIYTKRVDYLIVPAAYKAVVTFRWVDAHGRVQRTTTRTAGTCVEPDQRPDLVLSAFDAAARDARTADYVVTVRNDGRTVAGPSTVVLTVDGRALPPASIGLVAPATGADATITGPRCTPGTMVTIRVDATDAVEEASEDDDVVQRACPLV
jgi:CARDB